MGRLSLEKSAVSFFAEKLQANFFWKSERQVCEIRNDRLHVPSLAASRPC